MVSKDQALDVCQRAIAAARSDQAEAVMLARDHHLTRFATNHIHQNVAERDAKLMVRVAIGQKVGLANTNRLGAEDVAAVVREAEAIARLQRDNPHWRSLPAPPVAAQGLVSRTVDPGIRDFGPQERAAGVATIVDQAKAAGLAAAGTVSNSHMALAVVNSLGADAYAESTTLNASAVVSGEAGSGYAEATAKDLGEIDLAKVGRVAVEKALAAQNPSDLPPGEYTVVLEPAAVGDLLQMLAFLGLGAQAAQEGRSFMAGKLGEQVVGENISIWDDGHDPQGLPFVFDLEGVPKQRVSLIENGVARGFVYDSLTASREDRRSTGHALMPEMTYGPLPLNLFMAPGQTTLAEMIASTQRGVLVTRFHYTNPVHPVKAIITGMTRDGTFLIENGRIARPVKNLRFTESILRAFSGVEGISRERELLGMFSLGGMLVPAIKVAEFSFTGATDF